MCCEHESRMTTRIDYAHEQVFARVTPELALEAERFWERCGVIPNADERRRRASELAAIVRDHNGRLAGVQAGICLALV